MLRIIPSASAAGAKSYYQTADYYLEGQELAGEWRGEGAKRLGLEGRVEQSAWERLCDNRDPTSGARLTLRQKTDRRVGYDFNFHVPKSVSLLHAMTRDDRLLDAFRDAVSETMQDMEVEMKTRVRKGGKSEDRVTGNMVWGEFVHFTSRPVDGIPDPHLHAHCFVFNTTWDAKEGAWKAGQFGDLKRDAPYFEAKFHARLGHKLTQLGLPVARTKTGWELEGLDASTLAKFSRRTALIEAEARRNGVVDPAAKSELGAKTRERKQKGLGLDELHRTWLKRLSQDERHSIQRIALRIGSRPARQDPDAARRAIVLAADHVFERRSVVPERTLLAESLKRSVGHCAAESIEASFRRHDFLFADRNGRRMVTTRSVLAEEQRLIDFAREGRGTARQLGQKGYAIQRTWLNDGQRKAVEHVLTSRDRMMLVRGAAGVGKTTMMQEAVEGIEAGGSQVFTFAPSSAATDVLRQERFERADTVARLLVDTKLQAEVRGQVLWIDEAGLLGTRTLREVFELAERNDCRVVLSGDRRQHGSVERGAALRLLEEEAGLISAEIREIQRQAGDYKRAVQALADGRAEDGFQEIDRLGWIREVPTESRYKTMAADYLESTAAGVDTLVVSPTHSEGERITAEIRSELKRQERLGDDERSLLMLQSANLTEAERSESSNFLPGDVLVFHQNAKGFAKGQRVEIGTFPLPLMHAGRFQVFHRDELRVASGDLIRVTRNGKTLDGHRLTNGSIYRVRNFDESGNIVLENGSTVAKDYGHLAHGYCVTSHSSQGRTVSRVLIGQSAESFAASSREQFYVSASRGRKSVTIYTDDKASLLEAVRQSDDRLTATEVMGRRQARRQMVVIRRQRAMPAYGRIETKREKERDVVCER